MINIDVLKNFSNEDTISLIGFGVGLVYAIFDNKEFSNIIEHPLFTLFNGSIFGYIFSLCAIVIANLMPPEYRIVVPIFLIFSCVNHIYNHVKCEKHVVNNCKH
jgi:hypothetical protein